MDAVLYFIIALAAVFGLTSLMISVLKDLRRSKGRHIKKGCKKNGVF